MINLEIEPSEKLEYLMYVYQIVSANDRESHTDSHLSSIRDSIYNKKYSTYPEEFFNKIHAKFTSGDFPRYQIETIRSYLRNKKISSILGEDR